MKNAAIFGCGGAGKSAYLHLRSKCRIVAFLDNDKSQHGSRVFGVPVYDPEKYDYRKVEHVFIGSMYFDAILVQLMSLGVPHSKFEMSGDGILLRNPPTAGDGRGFAQFLNPFRKLFFMPFRLLR